MRFAPDVTFVALANGTSVLPEDGSNTEAPSSAGVSPFSIRLISDCKSAAMGSLRCLYSAAVRWSLAPMRPLAA